MLIECADCGTSVSDRAESCPKCGMPVNAETVQESVAVVEKRKNKSRFWYGLWSVFIGLTVIGLIQPTEDKEFWELMAIWSAMFAMLGFWIAVAASIRRKLIAKRW